MSKLELFLQSLSNSELAFFYKYRYTDFLVGSRAKIDKEIDKRKITKQEIHSFLTNSKCDNIKYSKYDLICPRCKSKRIIIDEEKKLRFLKWISYEKSYNKYTCQICLYSFEEPKGRLLD